MTYYNTQTVAFGIQDVQYGLPYRRTKPNKHNGNPKRFYYAYISKDKKTKKSLNFGYACQIVQIYL